MKGYGITDKGKVRRENQDSYVLKMLPAIHGALLVVCDGMGGAQAGGIASALAAEAFAACVAARLREEPDVPLADLAREAAIAANAAVFSRASQDPACKGMGTTLVAAILRDGAVTLANVGDSRAYYFHDGTVLRLTRDHSLVEEMVDAGQLTPEQAASHPQKNLITRALGVEPHVICDVYEPEVQAGDTLLLCSDGLSNQVQAEEMLAQRKKSKTVHDLCKKLLKRALERGAPDNVTVCAIQL